LVLILIHQYYFSYVSKKVLFWALMLRRFSAIWKGVVLCCLVFWFFVFMSGLDFVVHRVLYGYGLRFSYDWAVGYWRVYGSVFLVFAVVVGFVYWLGSGRSESDVKVGLGLFLSVFLLSLGGLQDVVWFVFWGGGLPANDVIWWWMPWFGIFGFWNSLAQLCLLGVVFVIITLFWIRILGS
jgi:hypothetical protein